MKGETFQRIRPEQEQLNSELTAANHFVVSCLLPLVNKGAITEGSTEKEIAAHMRLFSTKISQKFSFRQVWSQAWQLSIAEREKEIPHPDLPLLDQTLTILDSIWFPPDEEAEDDEPIYIAE